MKHKVTYPLVIILIGLLAAGAALAQEGGFEVPWHTVDGGGGASAGGGYSISGTIGQPDAGPSLSGNGFNLSGGFWQEQADQGSNSAPIAVDDAVTTVVGQAITVSVLANDTDPNSDALSVSNVTQGTNGSVSNNVGSVTYTPIGSFTGTDTFTYIASDGDLTDNATVTVAVTEGDSANPVDSTQGGTIIIDNHAQSSKFLSTTIEFPPGSVPDSTTIVFDEQTYSGHDVPPGYYFAGLFFSLDAYVGAEPQPGFTFTKPVTLTFHFNRVSRPSLRYWDGSNWSTDGITVIESDRTKLVVTIDHLTEFAVLSRAETVYLPFIAQNSITAPDLVVQSVTATSDSVQVVIANQGNAPVANEFWVQVYVDPDPVPSAVNQLWYDLSDEGMFWSVTSGLLPLAPGGTVTLTYNDAYYWPSLSHFDAALAPGTPLYAQVDAYNESTDYGAVLESHEIGGGAYNNVGGPFFSTAFGNVQ